MEIPRSFIQMGEAPVTRAHKIMATAATPQFIQDMRQLINERVSPLITKDLVSITKLNELFGERGFDDIPEAKTLARTMEINGYSAVGRFLIDGERHRFWSTNPERFPTIQEVRKHIQKPAEEDDGRTIEDSPFEDLDEL